MIVLCGKFLLSSRDAMGVEFWRLGVAWGNVVKGGEKEEEEEEEEELGYKGWTLMLGRTGEDEG